MLARGETIHLFRPRAQGLIAKFARVWALFCIERPAFLWLSVACGEKHDSYACAEKGWSIFTPTGARVG
jgi:hypothetical protein